MWTQSTSVTDRQTDGRTDGQTDRQTDRITITDTVQRIASHGKKCTRTRKRTASSVVVCACAATHVVRVRHWSPAYEDQN